jgi:DNA-binding transcriptional regulator YhcF (GntR family)
MTAPLLQIDLGSTIPAYRQIANAVRAQLVARVFRPGDQLPTVRRLAMDLGVHHNTIAEAYRILAEEGWLDLRRRHGVTVLPREQPAPLPDAHETFSRKLRELAAEAHAEGLPDAEIIDGLRALAQSLKGKDARR